MTNSFVSWRRIAILLALVSSLCLADSATAAPKRTTKTKPKPSITSKKAPSQPAPPDPNQPSDADDDNDNQDAPGAPSIAPAITKDTTAPADDDATTPIDDANDDATYDLRYKFATGDVLKYSVDHRASIRSTIDESTQSAETKTESVKVWKVTDVLPQGDIEFMNVVERVHMVNQLPDRDATEYDSDRDKTPPPGFETAAKSIGVPLSVIRMTPHGEIVRRDVKYHQQGAEENGPIVVRLPDEPVAIGATWDEPFDVQVEVQGGGPKAIQTRRHFKLTGVSHGIATIEATYQVLSPIDAQIESQLVQKLMSGEVRFDIKAGRIVGQQMDIDKRILGFAGATSSMQYIMRMEEKLEPPAKSAAKPPASTTANRRSPAAAPQNATATTPKTGAQPRSNTATSRPTTAAPNAETNATDDATDKPATKSTSNNTNRRRSSNSQRSANRADPTQAAKGYRR